MPSPRPKMMPRTPGGRLARASIRTIGTATIAGLLILAPRRAEAVAQTGERPPNIVFIMADDLGYGELGCYGQQIIRTPSIDSLAAEGVRFTQMYAGQTVCAPSRCVLMTGRHTGHATIRDNGNPPGRPHDPAHGLFPGQHPIPDSDVTIAELLRKKGYANAAIGKWGLGFEGSSGDPSRQGFDHFFGYLCQVHAHNHYPRFLWRDGRKEILEGNDRSLTGKHYSQDLFVDDALDFIRAHRDRAFFLYLPFIVPHLSIQVPEAATREYLDRIPEAPYVHRGYLKHPHPRAGYAAMITHMDEGIGKILALLGELGLDERTLVIFTSDNGPTYDRLGGSDSAFFRSAGPLRGLKGSLYEGGIRVPFVARWPGKIAPGRTSEHVAAFWDVLPTLCEMAGVTPPADIDGISFLPELLGQPSQREHEYLYWEFPSYGGQQAVRMGRWKGIRRDMFKGNLEIELYDLQTDIGEATNVAARQPETVRRIEQIMMDAHVDSPLFDLFGRVRKVRRLDPKGLLAPAEWRLVRVDSESRFNGKLAGNAFDGDPATWWHTEWRDAKPGPPHEIVIDLGAIHLIEGFRYLPRTDGGVNGTIEDYAFYVSLSADRFGEPVAKGRFPPGMDEKEVRFEATRGRYVRLVALSEINDQPFTSIAELGVLGR